MCMFSRELLKKLEKENQELHEEVLELENDKEREEE